MSTSSIIVVANALRLNRLTIDSPQSNESEGDRRLLSSTTRPGLAA
jgi:hypothetical protein